MQVKIGREICHLNMNRWKKNREHWDQTLDARNLESKRDGDFQREVDLYLTQDVKDGLRFFGPLYQRRVLDLGGGLGQASALFLERGASVVLCDISLQRCIAAKRTLEKMGLTGSIECIVASSDAMPFTTGAFDCIWTKSVLIHTPLKETAMECARILSADEGQIWFIEPKPHNPFVNLYRRLFAPKIWQQITQYFTMKEFSLFQKAIETESKKRGFSCMVTKQHYYWLAFFASVFAFFFSVPVLYRIFEKILMAVDRIVFWFVPTLKKQTWFSALGIRTFIDRNQKS